MHLAVTSEFIAAFIKFSTELQAKHTFKDEENVLRLFDIWLANYKDEKVLGQQLEPKDPWQSESDGY